MAYDMGLAERIRGTLDEQIGVSEKTMFGGIAFLVRGHMSVGIVQDKLMVRVGPEDYERALKERHARPMDFTGRPMKGFVYVLPAGYEADGDLARWVERGVQHAISLIDAAGKSEKRTRKRKAQATRSTRTRSTGRIRSRPT
jgi:TfoX/Sxy family transcriptional regulator of competence genes